MQSKTGEAANIILILQNETQRAQRSAQDSLQVPGLPKPLKSYPVVSMQVLLRLFSDLSSQIC